MRSFVLILFVFVSLNGFCQAQDPETSFDTPAEYPGGEKALIDFIKYNLRVPYQFLQDTSLKKCTVYLKYFTDTLGVMRDIVVAKGCKKCKPCELEALRVAKLIPPWKPATKNGKPAKADAYLPINFNRNQFNKTTK